MVAEVTQPSLGVGYEIGRAVAMGKKVLCLYRPSPDKSKLQILYFLLNNFVRLSIYIIKYLLFCPSLSC